MRSEMEREILPALLPRVFTYCDDASYIFPLFRDYLLKLTKHQLPSFWEHNPQTCVIGKMTWSLFQIHLTKWKDFPLCHSRIDNGPCNVIMYFHLTQTGVHAGKESLGILINNFLVSFLKVSEWDDYVTAVGKLLITATCPVSKKL